MGYRLPRLVNLITVFGLLLTPHSLLAVTPKTIPHSVIPATKITHLEIHIRRRQVTVYHGNVPAKTYPIAVGRQGWETPLGNFRVAQMLKNPTWIHPFTGKEIAGGDPENPLGHYWIGFWTDGRNWIGFHGTTNPESVGKSASHGCIRMYSKDVEELYKQVKLGTIVSVMP